MGLEKSLLSKLAGIACILMYAMCAFASSASAAPACEVQYAGASVAAEVCALSPVEKVVQLTFARADEPAVTFHAQFSQPLFNENPGQYQKMWDRLWSTGGTPKISADDQKDIREILQSGRITDESLKGFVDFIANFVEPGTRLQDFDRLSQSFANGRPLEWRALTVSYTMICESIGFEREAWYTLGDVPVTLKIVVGDPADRCRGRCGFGCSQPLQIDKNQYTQECLNHDACRDATGHIFGQCTDEFWKAAAGYMLAPNCETH